MVQLSEPPDLTWPGTPRPTRWRRVTPAEAVVGGALVAGLSAIAVARWATGTGYRVALFGLPDIGRVTSFGLPVAQFIHEWAGLAVVGLLFLRCLSGRDAQASDRHLVRMAGRWGAVWAWSTLVWIVFTVSDLVGAPSWVLPGRWDEVAIVVNSNRVLSEVATLWVALGVALFARRLAGRRATAVALLAAVAAMLPNALTGHASHHASPFLASVTLAVHVIASAIWVGALFALIVHLRSFPAQLRIAVPRFSTAALCCVIAIGATGLYESALTLDSWTALWASNRGHLIVAKTAALVGLGGIGYLHRRRTVGSAISGRLGPLLRLAAFELVLMGATVGIAVVLSTTA